MDVNRAVAGDRHVRKNGNLMDDKLPFLWYDYVTKILIAGWVCMKPRRWASMGLILVLLVALLAPSASAAQAWPKATQYEGGKVIELTGKLKITAKTKTRAAYAVLALDEIADFVRVNGTAGIVDHTGLKEIQVLNFSSKHKNKKVRVIGTLVGSDGSPRFRRDVAIEGAMVTVIPAVKSVSISAKKKSLPVGDMLQLDASAKPASAYQTIKWSSSKPSVASVDSSGLVIAHKKGTATITAKAVGGKKATCKVTVTVPVTGVQLSVDALSMSVGKSKTITASVIPANASNKGIVWSSSDTSVAKVSSAGKITARSSGSAVITATTKDGGFTARCTVTVGGGGTPDYSVERVELDFTSAKVGVGGTQQLTATVRPTYAMDKTVTWSTSNPSVATVNNSGLVTGVAVGSATITVTTNDGGKTAQCQVTVADVTASTEEQQMFDLLNQKRTASGRKALTMDLDLQDAARIRARELSVRFSDTRPDGTSFSTVSPKARAEIYAGGWSAPSDPINYWVSNQSDIVYATGYTRVGAGHYFDDAQQKHFWIILFGN